MRKKMKASSQRIHKRLGPAFNPGNELMALLKKAKEAPPNSALMRERKATEAKDVLEPLDLTVTLPAIELAYAAKEYLGYFDRCAESPKVNACRHKIEKLIKEIGV